MKIHFTVHVYAEEKLYDEVLIPHSRNYGIVGKNIIAPLRKINNSNVEWNIDDTLTVEEFYEKIDEYIYSGKNNMPDPYIEGKITLDFVKECKILKKYILKNGIRYSVRNEEKNLGFYLSRLNVEQNNTINIQILVSSDAGTVYRDHGIRFYINCREGTKHNEPHIHVDIRYGEATGAFSLKTGQQLTGDKIGRKDKKIIEETISLHQSEFLQYWNEHTDGLDVDLNQVLGLIKY